MADIDINKVTIRVGYRTFLQALKFMEQMATKMGKEYVSLINKESVEIKTEQVIKDIIQLLKQDFDYEADMPGPDGKKLFSILKKAVKEPELTEEDFYDMELWILAELFVRIFVYFQGGNLDDSFLLKRVMQLVNTTEELITTDSVLKTQKKEKKQKKKTNSAEKVSTGT